jgi:hypothetical protein
MNLLKRFHRIVPKNMYVKFTEKNGMVSVKLNHVQRPNHVIPGFEITKQRRQLMLGVVSVSGGQSMKAENYQRKVIEDGTGFQCPKSDHMRINAETYEIAKNVRPYSGPNASYDWTEDFDGLQTFGNKCHIYYNFKSIVEAGGSQTRSLKCVCDFVKAQRDVIHKSRNLDRNTFFVNILDGEVCAKNMHLFREFDNEDQIYVGDLYGYFDWLNSKLDTIL